MNKTLVKRLLSEIDPGIELNSWGLTEKGYSLVYTVKGEKKEKLIRMQSDLDRFCETLKKECKG